MLTASNFSNSPDHFNLTNASNQVTIPSIYPQEPVVYLSQPNSEPDNQTQFTSSQLTEEKLEIHSQQSSQHLIPTSKISIILGDYKFSSCDQLGQGAYSHVYQGINQKQHPIQVAIKKLNLEQIGYKKVQQEIKLLQQIHSDYVVKIYDYSYDPIEQNCYLILEYCNQGALSQYEFTLQKSVSIFQQILQGMQALKENKILHRDLKLDNIFLHNDAPKIGDFGFARQMITDQIQSNKCGTPETMAPEIFFSSQDPVYTEKSDVWSLGVILFQLAYHRHPFNYDLNRILTGKIIKIKSIDPIIQDFVERALEVNVAKRMDLSQCFMHPIMTWKPQAKIIKMNQVNKQFLGMIVLIFIITVLSIKT